MGTCDYRGPPATPGPKSSSLFEMFLVPLLRPLWPRPRRSSSRCMCLRRTTIQGSQGHCSMGKRRWDRSDVGLVVCGLQPLTDSVPSVPPLSPSAIITYPPTLIPHTLIPPYFPSLGTSGQEKGPRSRHQPPAQPSAGHPPRQAEEDILLLHVGSGGIPHFAHTHTHTHTVEEWLSPTRYLSDQNRLCIPSGLGWNVLNTWLVTCF